MERKNPYSILFILLLLIHSSLFSSSHNETVLKQVTLQLKWSHQFQFAGYYAALEKGFYRDQGLDVALKPGGPDILVDQEVLSGRAQMGVLASELIKMRAEGASLVLLAVIMQHSPRAVIVRFDSDIYSPAQLSGKKLMLNRNEDPEFLSMFLYEGVREENLSISQKTDDANRLFLDNEIDAMNGSIANQPYLFRQEGIETRLIRPINYGVDFYGDSLFTSEQMLRDDPEMVARFREASLRGWEYAMAHPDEIIEIIRMKYNQNKSLEQLQFEAGKLRNIILPDLIDIGHINPHRINRIAEIYSDLGIIPSRWSLDGFIFEPDNPRVYRKNRILGLVLYGFVLSFSIVFLILYFVNNRLKRIVKLRTRELSLKNKELQNEIAERELAQENQNRLTQQLQQVHKMEAIGTLAGGIAHDFNNILGAILGYSELAREVIPEGRGNKYLDEVINAGLRARDLVRQILAFSRMSSQEKIPVRMELILMEVIKLLRVTIPSTIEINIEINVENILVLADPTQIHQIMMNLCTNAFQAMDEKGVLSILLNEVNLDGEDGGIPVSPGRYVCLSIRDSGSGMDKLTMNRIFDPYFTTKDIGKGSGMGLSVVHGILKDLDGHIRVESRLGEGSLFLVYIPCLDGDSGTDKLSLPDLPRGSEHILVVDDDSSLAELNKQIFKNLGYRVTVKTDSQEAYDLFRTSPETFDLLFTDQTMPRLTGLELSGEIFKIRPEFPVIICTGYSSRINESDARKMGIKAVSMKPLETRELAFLIRRVLDEEGFSGIAEII